jgi:hydrogenase maturation protease
VKTLILGLGNDLLADDAVGLEVVRRLSRETKAPEIEIRETCAANLELLDFLVGFDRVIIVDAIRTGTGKAGDVRVLDLTDMEKATTPTSLHHVGLPTVLAAGKVLGAKMPARVRVFGIEATDVSVFGGPCSPEVEAAIPKVVDMIRAELGGSPAA